MKTITLSLLLLLSLPTFAQNGNCQVNWKMHIKQRYRNAIGDYVRSISNVANPTNTFNSEGINQMGIFLIEYNPDSLGYETLTIRPCFDESWQEFVPDSYFFTGSIGKVNKKNPDVSNYILQQNTLCLVYNKKGKRKSVNNTELACWKNIVQDRVYERKPEQVRMQLDEFSRPWADSAFVKEHIGIGFNTGGPSEYPYNLRIFRQRTGERIIRFKEGSEEYSIREY